MRFLIQFDGFAPDGHQALGSILNQATLDIRFPQTLYFTHEKTCYERN